MDISLCQTLSLDFQVLKMEVRKWKVERMKVEVQKEKERSAKCGREKIVLHVFLIPRMNVEECANTHALCFERRTRGLEAKFLIYPHYGV